jgi:hypothetical protein
LHGNDHGHVLCAEQKVDVGLNSRPAALSLGTLRLSALWKVAGSLNTCWLNAGPMASTMPWPPGSIGVVRPLNAP